MRRLAISFSGGRTSAFMTWWCLNNLQDQYDEIVVTFANTGEENPLTLLFIAACDLYFGFNTVWLEAVVNPEHGVGTTARVVNFETASRNGEPFEAVIAKYGIPNVDFQPCNRELKTTPMRSYIRSLGWKKGTYDTAIGIRADEPNRINPRAAEERIIYPLVDMVPTEKPDINDWWDEQPFRLQLQEHQGNCKTCWKKSRKKLIRIAAENPEYFDFNRRMEQQYGHAGSRYENGLPRRFFRGYLLADDIINMAKVIPIAPVREDADQDAGCSESCEAF